LSAVRNDHQFRQRFVRGDRAVHQPLRHLHRIAVEVEDLEVLSEGDDGYAPAMDDRERRLAQNEVLFREVNERVRDIASKLGDDGGYEYFCECANKDCTFRVSLRLTDYEAIRSDPKQFVVLADHYTPEVEDVVTKTEAFWVVRKTGETGEYVEQLDPRSRG
jgi:hypothetical protein